VGKAERAQNSRVGPEPPAKRAHRPPERRIGGRGLSAAHPHEAPWHLRLGAKTLLHPPASSDALVIRTEAAHR